MKSLIILAVFIGIAASADLASKDIRLKDVERTLDVKSQLVKESTVYTLESSTKQSYFLVASAQSKDRVAYAQAHTGGKSNQLKVSRSAITGHDDLTVFRVDVNLPAKEEKKVTVEIIYVHALSPHPTHITQSEQQYVVLEDNVHTSSPYEISKEKTIIKLAPGQLESHTKEQPTKHEGDTLTYGPYDNLAPFSYKALKVHYENNSPFLTVTRLTRVIEVSNWGNIAVEETISLTHTGANLKGSFSRFDFQRDRRERMPAIQNFKTLLPASARDVYYRDEIGNISTSNLREMDEAVEMEIRPRFPLFGGWKSNYYIGYNVPSYEYLYSSGNKYVLNMRFVDHIYDNFVIDELEIKVILPEGAENLDLKVPYAVERAKNQVHKTYLDTSGRPVVIAKKSNLVANHIQDFQLSYTFDRMGMIREPLMLITAFYLFFLVLIIYVRLDFTIAKDATSEARLKVSGIVQSINEQASERQAAYEIWSDAINKYKTNKDASALNSARKKAENTLKNTGNAIANLQTELKADSPDAAEKVGEMNKLDKNIKDSLTTWTTAVERLVSGKLNKQNYSDTEKQTKGKIDELRDKMDTLLYSL